MIKKSKPPLRRAAVFTERNIDWMRLNRAAMEKQFDNIEKSRESRWTKSRTFYSIAEDLMDYTNIYLTKEAESMYHRLHRPIRIMDDGAGNGFFLHGFKDILSQNKIPCTTTAISLHDEDTLHQSTFDGNTIDHVHIGPAERYTPTESQDIIISTAGSISYTHPRLRKNQLLKYAESLSKEGILIVGFYFSGSKSIPGGVREKTATIHPHLLQNKPPARVNYDMEKKAISRAFEKRGFAARFFETKAHSMPGSILVVRRKK